MNDLFKKRNEFARKLASMTPDDVLKMRTGYAGKSQQWQYGFDLACREKQAEIDALKAENKRLQEKSEHLTIARFNWRTKYLTLATSALLILGLDESTSRDEIINAVGALKAQCDELLAAQQWQPIESAPRDGTRILVAVKVNVMFGQSYWQIDSVCVNEDTGEICDEDYRGWSDLSDYSHWMPEPQPPEAIAKARGESV